MKKICMTLLALVLVAGCSSKPIEPNANKTTETPETNNVKNTDESNNEKKIACTVNSDSDKIKTLYIMEENQIVSVIQETTYGLTKDRDKESIMESMNSDKQILTAMYNVGYEIIETDTEITSKITYDISKIDEATLAVLGLMDEMKTDGKYDINKVVEGMTKVNATCSEVIE